MYKIEAVTYPQAYSDDRTGYQIYSEEDEHYLYWINKYLHFLANKSSNTARQYGYRLCRYLNFLKARDKTYLLATNSDLKAFITSINITEDENTILLTEGSLMESTLRSYLMTIKRFYVYLWEQNRDFLMDLEPTVREKNRKSLLYGNVWEESSYEFLLSPDISSSKKQRVYEKWYSEDEIEAILSAFNTNRDRAMFALTLDGLRIDEVLSIQKNDVDLQQQTVKLTRSKGKTKETARTVILSERSSKLIQDYLFSERDILEMELLEEGKIPDQTLFLNLRKRTDSYGRPVQYTSWQAILKRAAKKAGMDPKRIRTHSGRSTRAQELYNLQSQFPDQLSDSQIKQIMGWKNIDSGNPYKNDLDKQTALNNHNLISSLREEQEDERS